jgi:cytochrome c biogenesis protein CcdA
MNNQGQFMPPFFKWLFGLIMIFTLAVIYYFFQPIIFSSMPSFGGTTSAETTSIISSFQNNWSLAMTILVFGFGFYIFLSGLPGQTEENPF